MAIKDKIIQVKGEITAKPHEERVQKWQAHVVDVSLSCLLIWGIYETQFWLILIHYPLKAHFLTPLVHNKGKKGKSKLSFLINRTNQGLQIYKRMIGGYHEEDGYVFDKYQGKADLNTVLILNKSQVKVHRM